MFEPVQIIALAIMLLGAVLLLTLLFGFIVNVIQDRSIKKRQKDRWGDWNGKP